MPIVDPDPAGVLTYLASAVLLALGIAIFLYILIREAGTNRGREQDGREAAAETGAAPEISSAASPTFATGRTKSLKPLIFCGRWWLGRHHSAGGHSYFATSAAVILGGGWAGKLIFNRWSRMA